MRHSKQKGNLGFSATLKELHKLGYNVFSEIGDLSKIDLIVEINNILVKIQVKYAAEQERSVILRLRKCGPNNYNYLYSKDDVDLFSVYLPIRDKIIFVPVTTALVNKNSFIISLSPAKNNQVKNTHIISEFENLNDILLKIAGQKR